MKRSRNSVRPRASTALPSRSNSMMSSAVTSAGASERDIRKRLGLAGWRALTWPKPSRTPKSARTRLPVTMSSIKAASAPGIELTDVWAWTTACPNSAVSAITRANLIGQMQTRCPLMTHYPILITLPPSRTDRRLERQCGIPGKVNPGVLRHFGDEGIDQRLALGLGVDGGEMRVRHHRTHQPPGLAGVDEVVDDQ